MTVLSEYNMAAVVSDPQQGDPETLPGLAPDTSHDTATVLDKSTPDEDQNCNLSAVSGNVAAGVPDTEEVLSTRSAPVVSSSARRVRNTAARTRSAHSYRNYVSASQSWSAKRHLGLVTDNFVLDLGEAYTGIDVNRQSILIQPSTSTPRVKSSKQLTFQRVPSMLLPRVRTRLQPDIVGRVRSASRKPVLPLDPRTTLELSTRTGGALGHLWSSQSTGVQSPSRLSASSRLISSSLSSLSSVESRDHEDTFLQPRAQNSVYLDTFASATSVIAMLRRWKSHKPKDSSQAVTEGVDPDREQLDDIDCPECKKLLQDRGHDDQFVKDWWNIVRKNFQVLPKHNHVRRGSAPHFCNFVRNKQIHTRSAQSPPVGHDHQHGQASQGATWNYTRRHNNVSRPRSSGTEGRPGSPREHDELDPTDDGRQGEVHIEVDSPSIPRVEITEKSPKPPGSKVEPKAPKQAWTPSGKTHDFTPAPASRTRSLSAHADLVRVTMELPRVTMETARANVDPLCIKMDVSRAGMDSARVDSTRVCVDSASSSIESAHANVDSDFSTYTSIDDKPPILSGGGSSSTRTQDSNKTDESSLKVANKSPRPTSPPAPHHSLAKCLDKKERQPPSKKEKKPFTRERSRQEALEPSTPVPETIVESEEPEPEDRPSTPPSRQAAPAIAPRPPGLPEFKRRDTPTAPPTRRPSYRSVIVTDINKHKINAVPDAENVNKPQFYEFNINMTSHGDHTQKSTGSTWSQGRLALSQQSSRFELPMDMKMLESMTPAEYLGKYCVVTSKRQWLYEKIYLKHKDPKLGGLNLKGLEKALKEALVDTITGDDVTEMVHLAELKDTTKVDQKLFIGITAMAERILYPKFLTEDTQNIKDHKKEKIECADFSGLEWKFHGVHVNPSMKKLLEAL